MVDLKERKEQLIKEFGSLDKLMDGVKEFCEENENNVRFYGVFMTLDNENEVSNKRIIGYGIKNKIVESLNDYIEEISNIDYKDDEFINW